MDIVSRLSAGSRLARSIVEVKFAMLGMRCAFLLRGRPSPTCRMAPHSGNRPTSATVSRDFASAAKAPSKWPKRLLIGVSVTATTAYLLPQLREHLRRTKQQGLRVLGDKSVQEVARLHLAEGDLDQATRYWSASFGAVRDPADAGATINEVCEHAAMCESVDLLSDGHQESPGCGRRQAHGRHGPVLPPHDGSRRSSIRLYEKYRAEFSASSNSPVVATLARTHQQRIPPLRAVAGFDGARQRGGRRLEQLVRDSAALRTRETALVSLFDDLMALHATKEERRRGRHEDGHDMMLGRLAARRGLVLPRKLLQGASALAAPRVATARALSTAARGGRGDGFYVSKRAAKSTLVLGAVLTGGFLYLKREDADRKEIRLLLERNKDAVTMATTIGVSYEKMDQFAKAIQFYRKALENLPVEMSVVYREDLRVQLLDHLGQCYKQTGDSETAEKHFQQAIEAYDQLKGKLSLSPDSDNDPRVLSKLDENLLNVFLHYVVLLTTLQRPDDAARARRRLSTIARGSPHLRGQVHRAGENPTSAEADGDEDSDFV
ncbi:Progesterone-induced-blocking factor 1 [Phytophthora pseudosyringae]|uniref:Progesterone-induced-blocking factor 1 n=1 Tax=Phytophthora pseudosyringae TaxID=221518 RepID=A0A8T1WE16_9STRA|nr:Progesterone-induced-blocking factor 1 [Phytophthora pseudosyringae]